MTAKRELPQPAESLIFSFDAETDGLYGEPWAIGAVVLEGEKLVDRFAGQIDPCAVTDPWVRENIVPVVNLPRYDSQEGLLNAFWEFWLPYRDQALCVADFGAAVEAYLFRRCVAWAPAVRTWLGPYPMHELGTALHLAGIDPDVNRREMCGHPDLTQHDPVDDALAAGICWNIASRRIAEVADERDHLKAQFCPAGLHYRGAGLNLATGEPSACGQCAHDQRVAECSHDGDLTRMPAPLGWGWACAQCGHYFGSRGFNLPKDEALVVIRASLAAGS